MEKELLIKQIQNHLWPHAVLLEGHDDLIATAWELVRVLICPQNSSPSDQCSTCSRLSKGTLSNVRLLKSGIETLKKQELQAAIQQFSLSTLENNPTKVLVIDGCEMLSRITANTLLKFLEEPPQNTFIFLLTENSANVLPTIKSRCQRFVLISNTSQSTTSLLEQMIQTADQEDFLNLSYQWTNLPKEELIQDLNIGYKNLIIRQYPELAEPTLSLISDLKNWSFDRLAIINYLLALESIVRKPYENL